MNLESKHDQIQTIDPLHLFGIKKIEFGSSFDDFPLVRYQ